MIVYILHFQYRSSKFWEEEVAVNGPDKFKEDFRMKPDVFKKLCILLPSLKKQETNYRDTIPLEKRIAIALYALGSSSEYRTIANLFGVGRTTVGEIVMDFCREVVNKLTDRYLSVFPLSDEKRQELVSGFAEMGFPQCIGAIGKI